jgi:hypothetical protein
MENAIRIQLPISVSYPALEEVLKEKVVGEYIPRPEEGVNEPPYARILDARIEGSSAGDYDVILRIRISILRTVLKRDQVDLLVQASLAYDNETQKLFVRKYKLDSKTSSGFFNSGLEVLANKVAYNQIIKKARFNLGDLISRELNKANGLLESGLELKGIKLLGKVERVRVQNVKAKTDGISLLLELQGNLEVRISDLLSLMPVS